MTDPTRVADLLLSVATAMVDHVDAVSVRVSQTEHGVTYTLMAAPEEMGKLIGKQGRTARALRTILSQLRRVDARPLMLDIQHNE